MQCWWKFKIETEFIQGVPELAPQRKQACADNKKDSKLTKINFLLAQITELQSFKFHQSQKLVLRYYSKIRSVAKQQQKISDIAQINKMFGQLEF
jgi:hypothetical protein